MANKRKRTASNADHNQPLETAPRKYHKKGQLSTTDPTKRYGVFQHNNLLDTMGTVLYTALNFSAAHTHLLAHASSLISANAAWGATSTRSSHNTFEILGYDQAIRMRFDIDTLHSTADGDWVRERVWLATHYADRPREHYAMYVEVNCQDASRREDYFVSGFESLGAANSAMKTSALEHLAAHPGARLFERSIELVGVDGGVVQRYLIAKGRFIDGRFVREENWVKKEIALRDGDEATLAALASDAAKKKGIMRLPTPPATADGGEEAEVTPALVTVQQEAQQPAAQDVRQQQLVQEVQQQPAQETQQQPAQAQEPESKDTTEQWCTCRKPDTGELMIGCDNDDCPVQWYHGRCLGLETAPEGDWLCPTCAPENAVPAAAASKKPGAAKGKGKAKGKGGKTTKTKTKVAAKAKGGKTKKT
ncbi:hypothetical protein IQ06DRAFT_379074 [Phaeosphaeriaceae sp. SRC1lsM3a]|nr:hypothetical protein IQ06DRAFT_379074 [Stagonospora sp. SRC1lsM3a]